MDFPVCPACGESVIDDDAEDCPFCGAPMKAKPGSKSAAKPAAAKPTAAKPTSATAGKAGSSASMSTTSKPGTATKPAAARGSTSSPADDFPFDAELPGAKAAIQAMPSPSKGRTLQVVCPMCETAGYVPPTAVGKEVKCANPKCMVPVFKAPAPTVEAAPPPPPKKSNLMLVGGITIAVMVISGGAMIFLSSQPQGPKGGPKVLSDEDRAMMREMAGNKPPVENEVKNTNKPLVDAALPDDKTKTTDATPKSPEDFIAAAIKQLGDACLIGDRRQRSKPFCRQMAADASVLTGDIKAANEHLSQLVIVGRTVPYYRIEPNLEKFWRAWSAGDKAAAKTALDAAVADAPMLQTVGRNQMEVAGRLAAALATADRAKEGLEILGRHQSEALEGQLAARVQMASDGRIARLSKSAAVLPWTKPQAAATTGSLVNHGQLAAGLAWAQKQPEEETRVECLAIWAEGFAQNAKGAGAMPEIDEAVKNLSPALAARVWARAACGRFAAGDQQGATTALKTAQDLIASVPVPKEPEMPNTKAAITYKQTAATPLVQAATAAAEIAYAHSLMPSHLTQAEEALELSLTFARGLAPALPAVTTKLDQAEQATLASLREKLKQELSLKSDDQAAQNVSKYRKVLSDMGEASQRRHQLQLTIMSRLAEVGLKNKVWSVVSNRSAETNASRRDDFLGSALIGILMEAFQGSETEKSIQGALGGANPVWPEGAYVRQFLSQQDYVGAALYVSSKVDRNSGLRDEVALMFATNLAAADKADAALGFISKLDDIVLREEAYRLSAALLTQRQRSDVVWKQVLALPQATEKASLCLGLVVGIKAPPQSKELQEPSLVP